MNVGKIASVALPAVASSIITGHLIGKYYNKQYNKLQEDSFVKSEISQEKAFDDGLKMGSKYMSRAVSEALSPGLDNTSVLMDEAKTVEEKTGVKQDVATKAIRLNLDTISDIQKAQIKVMENIDKGKRPLYSDLKQNLFEETAKLDYTSREMHELYNAVQKK